MTSETKQLSEITANNVALRDQYISIGGETIRLVQPTELIAYLTKVRETYRRWADLPENGAEPLFDPDSTPGEEPDDYLQVDAKPLPMRLAEFRGQPTDQEPPAQELLDAVGNVQHSVILGEPGSGKTTALERLAWVTADNSLKRAAAGEDHKLVIPILARLADYQGEADLLPMLRRVLGRNDIALATEMAVRAMLQATDARFVLLLDGLNELSRAHRHQGLDAVRRHMEEFARQTVHLTCRTADFDQEQAAAQLPTGTQLWTVQPLADSIRHWGDDEGESDVCYVEEIFAENRRVPNYWYDSQLNQPNQPVVGINWYEAMAYATWLARVTGKAYRLPSEAEWEWAARRNSRRYPWGNEWDADRCNWMGSGLNRPNPVGVYPLDATKDGLRELAGNISEWTISLHRGYLFSVSLDFVDQLDDERLTTELREQFRATGKDVCQEAFIEIVQAGSKWTIVDGETRYGVRRERDTEGEKDTLNVYRRGHEYDLTDGREDVGVDGLRVIRGGSWYIDKRRVRCAYRTWFYPRYGNIYLGMRLARTAL